MRSKNLTIFIPPTAAAVDGDDAGDSDKMTRKLSAKKGFASHLRKRS